MLCGSAVGAFGGGLFEREAAAQERPQPNSDEASPDVEKLEAESRGSGSPEHSKFSRASAPGDPAPDAAVEALRKQIDAILDRRVSSRAKIGIVAVDTTTGQVLYERNADEPLNPASNMKLVTSAAALESFGAAHTFKTELRAKKRSDSVVEGPLYVRGEGEAFLLFEDVVDWAADLKLKGIDRIEGGIVIDDTAFDGDYLPPGFDQKDEDASYRAPIGAVSINFNAVEAIVEPASSPGEKPSVRLFPPNGHVEIDNRAQTVAGSGQRLTFKSEPTDEGRTAVIIEGNIGTRFGEMRSRLRIDNPPAFSGSILARALEMVDIELEGPVRTGNAPSSSQLLLSHRSKPLSYVLLAMNKWSNNFMAEQLLRALGAATDGPATWERSRQRVQDFLEEVGIDSNGVRIHNGSGLYDGNEVSPRQFARLLTFMLDHDARPEFLSSLAVAGVDGTLADRMETEPLVGNLRGKTGTLNDVSALSGYLRTRSGRLVAFSVLFNDTPRRAWHYRPVQDEIARALGEFDE